MNSSTLKITISNKQWGYLMPIIYIIIAASFIPLLENFKELFKDGFNTGHGHLREPNSIGSYATLAAIAIQSNQNDQHR